MGTFTQLLINKQFDINIPSEMVENKLSGYSGNDFSIKQKSNNEYKFIANFSLGTLYGWQTDGIKIYMTLAPSIQSTTKIILKTRIRIELIFASVILSIFLAIQIFDNNAFGSWNLFGYFPLILLWFWLVYRAQEYYLLTKIEAYLATL